MELLKLISDILEGKVRTLSFANVACAPDKDIAAGALSALNFARLAFAAEVATPVLSKILPYLCSRKMVESALSICCNWPRGVDLEVEDVYRIPLFEPSLKSVSTDYGSPSVDHTTRLLENLRTLGSSAAIVFTRSSNVITCLRLQLSAQEVFVLFNPQVISEQEGVVSLTFSASVPQIARRLYDMFSVDKIPPAQRDLESQPKLLPRCAGHVFVPRAVAHDPRAGEDCLIVSSLTLLMLKAELEEITNKNGTLKMEKQRLERSVVDLEARLEDERAKTQYHQPSRLSAAKSTTYGPSVPRGSQSTHPPPSSAGKRGNIFDYADARGAQATHLPPSSAGKRGNISDYADARDSQATHPPPSSVAKRGTLFDDAEEVDPSLLLALQLQASFDSENDFLIRQQHELRQTAQRQYHCGVCLDDFPEDDAVRIDACGHEICRDCARGHVCVKIEEHRFPVLCPVCSADGKNQHPGTISGTLVQLLGVSEKQWEIWVEMELAQYSIPFTCRKCLHSGFVDRQDLEDEAEIHCPFPGCDHVWCKKCQQTIEQNGPKHSCDGTSELDHLMKQQGWRYCPNCKTPIQKTHGCNHLSCIAPGCNTHFCYRCGQTINRTAVRHEIQEGKTAHFRTCAIY